MSAFYRYLSALLMALYTALIAIGSLSEAELAHEEKATLLQFSVTPASIGRQLVRTSLPFRRGMVSSSAAIVVDDGSRRIPVAVRPLGYHVDSSGQRTVRQAMVTFPYEFAAISPTVFKIHTNKGTLLPPSPSDSVVQVIQDKKGGWRITFSSGKSFHADPIWPDSEPVTEWKHETVEQNAYYHWQRWRQQSGIWQRVVEFRWDQLGQVIAVAHLQRQDDSSDWAPRFGWEITPLEDLNESEEVSPRVPEIDHLWKLLHSFAAEESFDILIDPGRTRLSLPAAPHKQGGAVFSRQLDSGITAFRYLRSTPGGRVPMQEYAWRRAEFVLTPVGIAPATALLLSPHQVSIDPRDWDVTYQSGLSIGVDGWPLLSRALDYHRQAIIRSSALGHDWGNVTSFSDNTSHGSVFGMNRLNHAPELFFESMRTGDCQMLETALAWCDNFHDLTIWWGPNDFGGSRYNNIRADEKPTPEDDTTYMWRGDQSKTFCTKGYDSFQIAYELTGDPRMREALDAQLAYATVEVHTNGGECRNVGDVADFVRLYELTGEQRYLEQGTRLFRELRSSLSKNHLFDQSGKPIEDDVPFIDDDDRGTKIGYVKPYIIGYGLAGCPRLASHFPDEPGLQEMVRAIADFLVDSQDPVGGWRYPHPASSRTILSQAMEHANQLVEACQLLGPEEKYLDAIERVLRQRIWIFQATGTIANNLLGWEISTGAIDHPQEIYNRYQFPSDRDPTRDYREGHLQLGTSSPEGIVYFAKVLNYYLAHRPATRLLALPSVESPLGQILAASADYEFTQSESPRPPILQKIGVRDQLPVFYKELSEAMEFPLAWENQRGRTFEQWKKQTKRRVQAAFLSSLPQVDFAAKIIDTKQRDGYQAHKIELNLSGESRVLAYLLVPNGKGPFPAVLLLHDHGAEFRIGKEKLVHAWDIPVEKQLIAEQWVEKYYGGQYLGDELAKRGYVCLATDALNWSDRGGGGFEGQQALASNLMHFGISLAGLIAHEDLRAAEFLASRPEVDPARIAAMGLSMGAFRTWQVAAMSEHIAAGAAICWMATVKGLMQPGNNQTKGHSAYTMLHPGLLNLLDYPDLASLACPKPMLFYNGLQDSLFPVPSVEEAYKKLHSVWDAQRHEELLETRLWDVPHVFNTEMQDAAFDWLDRQLVHSK